MNIRTCFGGCLVLLVLSSSLAYAQEDNQPSFSKESSPAQIQKQKLERLLAKSRAEKTDKASARTDLTKEGDIARPKPLPPSATDKETRRLYEKALQDYYRYRSHGLEHRKAVFRWQLFSAKLIFAIVVFLVICGIVFAGIQFRVGLAKNLDNLGGDIEMKADGLKVSSPVLGVVILALSLAFFYLYLVFIYPIENVF